LAFIYEASGESEEAYQYLQKMQDISKAVGGRNLIHITDACFARVSIRLGDLGWAEQWVDRRRPCKERSFSFCLAVEHIAHAELMYWKGQYWEAARVLENLRYRCVREHILEAVLEVDLLYSAVLHALNYCDRARTIMEQALTFSETEGYIRPLVNFSPIISPILIDMAGSLPSHQKPSHIMTILEACGIDKISDVRPNEHVGDLTRRESEILGLMTAGLRDKEIANKTFLSLHTVKTHTKHIFQKLKVGSRVQAIRRAEELRFLKDR
jgi:LuxR family transcriptional regulator, maltose regulon positive regulatory protein